MKSGRTDAAAHLEQHSDIATVEGVSRTGIFAEWTGCKVHIAHESTRHSLPHIRFAKERGVDMTVETCPHYLFLSTDDGARLGPNFLRVKPPVREPGHREHLWRGVARRHDRYHLDRSRTAPAGREEARGRSGIARRDFRASRHR